MKVLQINSVCGVKSTGRICTDLASQLQKSGHQCLIAYGREQVPKRYRDISYRITSDFEVKLDGIKTRLLDNAGFNSASATRKLIKKIREFDPDVIHLHNLHGYYINIKILFEYLKSCKKKIVWTFHDGWAFTGHCACFSSVGCDGWKDGCKICRRKNAYPKSLFLNGSEKNFIQKKNLFTSLANMTIVTPSAWLAGLVNESFFGSLPVQIIHNGVDTGHFYPRETLKTREKYCLENKKIILGVASAWSKGKGLFDFVKLAETLPKEYRVVLVGLKEEQIASLPESITKITRTDSTDELACLYSAAEVFVNPTYDDNFPTTNIEALACGTQVITYATGGSPETVDDSCGFVVAQGDVDGLKKAVLKAVKDENTIAACIVRSKLFDRSVMCNAYMEIYQKKTK